MTHVNTLLDLADRVALVTGAASGMGKSSSLALAEAGAHLVLADINQQGAECGFHDSGSYFTKHTDPYTRINRCNLIQFLHQCA